MPALPSSARPSIGARPVRRRLLAPLAAAGLAAVLVGGVLASTPVTNGYRDHAYGGGAFRPTSDKPQSKLWYTDGSWFAGMFYLKTTTPPESEYHIYRLNKTTHSWADTGVVIDTRDRSRADYLWNETTKELIVASTFADMTSASTDNKIKIFKYTYNPTTNVYTPVAGFPKEIPGTVSASTVTVTRDSTGRLWAVWPKQTTVLYSYSTDGGVTWTAAAQHPAQLTNSIRNADADGDTASVIAFGTPTANKVGVMWSDGDELPSAAADGYYFSVIAAGADPAVLANWTTTKLPTLVAGPDPREVADNHINLKTTADGRVFMVGKTGKDTVGCATNKDEPLIEFFRRTATGAWSVHLVGTAGDCHDRPQLIISESLNTAWVASTSPNGGGAIYLKGAPLAGPEAFKFRRPADLSVQRGTSFIRSATETAIDDATTSKQNVTAASGIVVLANNILKTGTSNAKFYLHNEMNIAATDTTGPTGTIKINAGKAATKTATVSLALTASDAGSGVSLVRLSNSATVSGGVLTTGTTWNPATTLNWTLSAGQGTKHVYAQWRDAAGNWSTPVSDSIILDTTAPSAPTAPVHKLSNPVNTKMNVNVTWSGGTDTGGSGFAGYVLYQKVDAGAWTILGYPTTTSANVALDSSKTYQFGIASRDAAGNVGTTVAGPSFRSGDYPEAATQITYAGTWSTVTHSTYLGGKGKYSITKNSSASFTFSGTQVAWLSRKSSSHGTATVLIDGAAVATVNLYSATTLPKQVVFTKTWTTVGTHTIKVVVVGTAGHPRVTVDSFFVLK